jgi:hypothetical protein
VKLIFTLVAYRRIAKFPDNQTKRADNSDEDCAALRQKLRDSAFIGAFPYEGVD